MAEKFPPTRACTLIYIHNGVLGSNKCPKLGHTLNSQATPHYVYTQYSLGSS
ncbi:2-methylcitrate dehydratase [Venturia inaequalis]|nr:2-methylcitrate dehydratase [Venturia inaequalis]